MAKRLPVRAKPAPIVRLEQIKAELVECETQADVSVVEAKARLLRAWAAEQRKLLKTATLEELSAVEAEVEQLAREAGVGLILAGARRGELLGPKSVGGRGNKTVTPGVTVSRQEVRRWRRLAALVPDNLDRYLADCSNEGAIASRKGFLAWARAQARAESNAQERDAVAEAIEGGRAAGEPDPRLFDPPAAERDPYQLAADQLLAVAKRLEARTRDLDDPGLWSRGRDQLLERILDVAGRATKFARDRRESLA